MERLQWDDALAVGDETVDNQHRNLFRLYNELVDALKEGRGRDFCMDALAGLADYAREHFADEEAFMERVDYPELEEHHAEHEAFKEELALEIKAVKGGQKDHAFLARELASKLRTWLTDHLTHTTHGPDRRLAVWVKTGELPDKEEATPPDPAPSGSEADEAPPHEREDSGEPGEDADGDDEADDRGADADAGDGSDAGQVGTGDGSGAQEDAGTAT
jgi:hemerythrin-like metal-binding protein